MFNLQTTQRIVSHLLPPLISSQLPGDAVHVYRPVEGAGSPLGGKGPVSRLPDAVWAQGECCSRGAGSDRMSAIMADIIKFNLTKQGNHITE